MWSLMFNLMIVGTVAWIALSIVPVYLDNSTIRNVVKDVASDRSLSDASYDEINKVIRKRMSINSIRWITSDHVEFVDKDTHTEIRIDYEKRIKMVSNLDIILTFENHANLSNN